MFGSRTTPHPVSVLSNNQTESSSRTHHIWVIAFQLYSPNPGQTHFCVTPSSWCDWWVGVANSTSCQTSPPVHITSTHLLPSARPPKSWAAPTNTQTTSHAMLHARSHTFLSDANLTSRPIYSALFEACSSADLTTLDGVFNTILPQSPLQCPPSEVLHFLVTLPLCSYFFLFTLVFAGCTIYPSFSLH